METKIKKKEEKPKECIPNDPLVEKWKLQSE